MKENKLLPAEKQTVSAEPEVNTVSFAASFLSVLFEQSYSTQDCITVGQVTLSEDDEFIVLACDGIWYEFLALIIN